MITGSEGWRVLCVCGVEAFGFSSEADRGQAVTLLRDKNCL